MTYNVFGGMLNPTLLYSTTYKTLQHPVLSFLLKD